MDQRVKRTRKKKAGQRPANKAGERKKARAALHKATQLKKERFLDVYGKVGTITAAAQGAGITRKTHYLWLKDDDKYSDAFQEKTEEAGERLEQEARRRAVAGTDKPIVYQGEISRDKEGKPVTIKEYSDTLLIFLMKGAMPNKYGDRVKHTGDDGGPIEHKHRGVLYIGGSKKQYIRGLRKLRGE